MSRIPSMVQRENVELGPGCSTGPWAAGFIHSELVPLHTPGTIDRCSHFDPVFPSEVHRQMCLHTERVALTEWVMDCLIGSSNDACSVYQLPQAQDSPPKITQQQFDAAAKTLECDSASIKAVAEVETGPSGFLSGGRPKVRYEPAKFARLTAHRFDKAFPELVHSNNFKGAKVYDVLEDAMVLDARSALKASSWGTFQIMGMYHTQAGHSTIEDFVAAMYTSGEEHLNAFVNFVQSWRALKKALAGKDWAEFARMYNGPQYAKNKYDEKLSKAYAKYAGAGATSSTPKAGR